MSIPKKIIPIGSPSLSSTAEALGTARRAIEAELGRYYTIEFLREQRSAEAVLGRWISLMPGREPDDARDIEQFVQDLLLVLQTGVRSFLSDALSLFLGGIMPTYLRAKTLAGMLADGVSPEDVEGYFHSMAYGSVQRFIKAQSPQFKSRVQKKLTDLIQVMIDEIDHLEAEVTRRSSLAFVPPVLDPKLLQPPATTPPVAPQIPPMERVGQVVRAPVVWRALLSGLPRLGVLLTLVLIPANAGQETPEYKLELQRNREFAQARARANAELGEKIVIVLLETSEVASSNTTNNQCQQQVETNRKNGAQCEEEGYGIMERNLSYKRLVSPPAGRGLDGLFEKLSPLDSPNPFPEAVGLPSPGRLVFVPPDKKPLHTDYEVANPTKSEVYPKFVVFEAKHVSKSFKEDDHDGIAKETKRRLKNTCDGRQMGEKWTEERIPQALERESPGVSNKHYRRGKEKEIADAGYARWIFVCLPGAVGDSGKLYVLIDVVVSGMDLESTPPKARKQITPPDNHKI